jgi:hypothetical protein
MFCRGWQINAILRKTSAQTELRQHADQVKNGFFF